MSIVLDNVSKYFDTEAVIKDFSLEIKPGELFVLLGSSGSGKSTLLRMIAGLTPLDGGRVWLNGRDVTALSPQKRGVGFVFQNYSLFRNMNVAANIEFGLSVRRASRAERERRVSELLNLIGMDGFGDRMPRQLSGGQQQRVALARALAHQPDVLLLDEPFGALDVQTRVQLRQNLRAIQQRLKVTAILVTHDQEEAFELADRIGIIEGGNLLEVGTPADLYRHPHSRFAAAFLGNANLFEGQRNGSYVHLGPVALPAPSHTEHLAGQSVDILSRPEEIELALDPRAIRGVLIGQGIVQETAFAGPLERVSLRLPAQALNKGDHVGGDQDVIVQAVLSPDEAQTLGLAPGKEVWVAFKNYHLLPRETLPDPVALSR